MISRARLKRALASLLDEAGYRRGPLLMSELRKRWVRVRNPRIDIRFGKGVYLGPGFSLHSPKGRTTFHVGDNVEFRRGFRAELWPGARVTIGNDSYFTYNVLMACTTTITIGERCGFAQSTHLTDGNHRFRDLDKPFLQQGYDFHPLVIEDDVQVLSKCTIVASIATRTVLGAHAVVAKPLPPYVLAGGVPARVIDYFGPPGQEPEGWVPKAAPA